MILTCDQMQRSEERLFETGMEAEPLMDRAGCGVADVVCQYFPAPGRVRIYVGKGHNGGDALVAGRHLVGRGWDAELVHVSEVKELSPLTAKKLEQFKKAGGSGGRGSGGRGCFVLLDGLLGIGARGPLRGSFAEFTREMNVLRRDEHAATFAIDIPTGLDGDTGEAAEDAVVADVTVTMAQVKAGLIADGAVDFVGRLAVVALDEIVPVGGDDGAWVLEPRVLRRLIPIRSFETHKTMTGRVGIVAGSRGLTGAALLCAQGAMRAGAGLVTLYAHESVYSILASGAAAAAPEVMVKAVASYEAILGDRLDAVAIGPGLGTERKGEVIRMVLEGRHPMVVDADALNSLAAHDDGAILKNAAGPRILTPHPGEMARLWPGHPEGRRETAEAFVEANSVTLLLKGARTVVAGVDRPTGFNSTGHPGMASGGMGDVLSGICAGLLGQGLDGYDAACLGSWLLGRSAERAISTGGQSGESTVAGDVLKHLGGAFTDLRRGCY